MRHGIVAMVAAAVDTTLTELPQSRVRLRVRVPANELDRRLERKASELGRELRLPGFRRGKVPAPLVIQRVGREAVLEEAVRDTLSSWYTDAIADGDDPGRGDRVRVPAGERVPYGLLEYRLAAHTLDDERRRHLAAAKPRQPQLPPELAGLALEPPVELVRGHPHPQADARLGKLGEGGVHGP